MSRFQGIADAGREDEAIPTRIEGMTDAHIHIFGPFDRYPMQASRSYTPPCEATIAHLLESHTAVGLSRVVVVQPSIYGTDNRCTLDAVAELGQEQSCAVVLVDPSATLGQLSALARRGARGVRLNLAGFGEDRALARDTLRRSIDQAASVDWHLQLLTRPEQTSAVLDILEDSTVPVVFDHFGHVRPEAAHGSAFAGMLDLVRSGKAYVKASAGYALTSQPADQRDLRPLVERLLEANPLRLIWGSDWPHLDVRPDGACGLFKANLAADLARLRSWVGDDAVWTQIISSNAQSLYGFRAT